MNEVINGKEHDHLVINDLLIGVIDTPQLIQGKEKQITEAFISDLDSRMEKSKLEELGWRERDDINDIMRDLELLAGQDWQRAAKLWGKYRPNDIDKPIFIDGDDIDIKQDDQSNTREAEHGNNKSRNTTMPEALLKRFLQAENKFYFRNDKNKLAFEDKGKRLATEFDDPEISRSMVELAKSKGWSSIVLKGTEEFKREAWLHASLNGMDIQGFQPRDVDMARLADIKKEPTYNQNKTLNTIDKITDRTLQKKSIINEQTQALSNQQRKVVEIIKAIMRERGDSEKAVNMATKIAAERFQTNRVYIGKVLEHGTAPYENNQKNENSYYIKLQTETGEKIIWGVDLKRAINDESTNIGDEVTVAYQGQKLVPVKIKEYDSLGNILHEQEIASNRNEWDVRKLESIREEIRERLIEASKKSDLQPLVQVYDRDAPRTKLHQEIIPDIVHKNERTRS